MLVAIVTGAHRGLGFATAEALAKKNYEVIFAGRKIEELEQKISPLKKEGLKVHAMKLDVSDEKSIHNFCEKVMAQFPRLHVLVNNAGIMIDDQDRPITEKILETFKTNTLGPFLLTQNLWPALKKSGSGRVVNVSSGMGQLSEMGGGSPAYRISKTGLNAVTKIFSNQTSDAVLVNSICPGWVKTDMGGKGATRSLEQGISGILWAATLPNDGPNGGFFRDSKKMNW